MVRRRLIYDSPREDEQQDGDTHVGGGRVDPDVQREGREKGKQVGRLLSGLGVQDAHAERHEGHRKVHGRPALVGDGQVANGQIGFLRGLRAIGKRTCE